MTGLPFGLEFSPNNPDRVYQPSDGEYYGCSVVCGTPLVSGSFFVDINVSVLVSAFGFQQTVNESFSLPLIVEPGEGGDGPSSFALSANQGCAPLTIQGTNLLEGLARRTPGTLATDKPPNSTPPSYDAAGTYGVCPNRRDRIGVAQVNITTWWWLRRRFRRLFWLARPLLCVERSRRQHLHLRVCRRRRDAHPRWDSIPLDAGTTYIAFYDATASSPETIS